MVANRPRLLTYLHHMSQGRETTGQAAAKLLPWEISYAIADNAARVFAAERTSKNPEDWAVQSRKTLRWPAVKTLRWLWKTGDVSQRLTVAIRVAVWMGRDAAVLTERIKAR